ncbi:Oidioi.mRNA.OKI2018_I69.chr2.g6273.t1.cds [Oikopleura dioica]|uniref:6-pyruvoyltetrahydropterin synthase n=1 Tax=Oikopleura dioica TaxID=34765 RepID=A0ABN7T792_OIKDI|nr:Oidioi.mRNA.OKI2018_I69.chr2.g6273.t1.cds [Oikopleura dioica]
MKCSIIRTEKICTGHRLHSPFLTDEENKKVYGKCNHPNGHGHNYTIQAVIEGEIIKETGMVMNLVDLKQAMWKVLSQLDHKNVDKDVEYFKNFPSTAENIARWIFTQLSQELPPGSYRLKKIILDETDKNRVEIYE